MNQRLWAEQPIARGINPNTGVIDGDDSGYRNVPVSQLDAENPDPMVIVSDTGGVIPLPLYAVGESTGLCSYYPGGLPRAIDQILVRQPLAIGLEEVNASLAPYNRRLVVLDGFRPYYVQAALWAYLFRLIMGEEGREGSSLSIADFVRIGRKADEVGSYCKVLPDDAFEAAKTALMTGPKRPEIATAAVSLGLSDHEVVELYLTFGANLGLTSDLTLEQDAITAHGGGGAADIWLADTATGRFAFMGAPFDFVAKSDTPIASAAVIDYFDRPDVTVEVYAEAVAKDPVLRRYLDENFIDAVTPEIFRFAQRERRILFHAMEAAGGSYYSMKDEGGEFWHYQLGNERGGNQATVPGLEGSGNGCHALLRGKPLAAWGNQVGHRLARQLLAR